MEPPLMSQRYHLLAFFFRLRENEHEHLACMERLIMSPKPLDGRGPRAC